MTQDHRSPSGAALALAERLLRGATCRCKRRVLLSDDGDGCRWRLIGNRWEPGCDVPPITVQGQRGDHAAMARALAQAPEPTNRRQRRANRRRGRPSSGG